MGGWFGKQPKKTCLFSERRLGVVHFETKRKKPRGHAHFEMFMFSFVNFSRIRKQAEKMCCPDGT
jgi:hypothetical protein